MKKIAKIILINPKNKILLVLRDNKKEISYPNHWSEIGGEIEEHETPLEALKREIKEEISCNVYNISSIGKFFDKTTNAEIFVFKGNIFEDLKKIILYEGQKLGLFDYREISELLLPPPLKKFIIENKNKIFN